MIATQKHCNAGAKSKKKYGRHNQITTALLYAFDSSDIV